jgi:hypothetical protein
LVIHPAWRDGDDFGLGCVEVDAKEGPRWWISVVKEPEKVVIYSQGTPQNAVYFAGMCRLLS